MRFDELVKEGGRLEEAPGAGETFLNKAVNAVPGGRLLTDMASTGVMQAAKALGVGREGATLTPQARAELARMGVGTDAPRDVIPDAVENYRQLRDTRAERTERGAEANPVAAGLGTATGVGLSLLAPLPKVPGNGLGSSMATGAGYGAFEGLTNGRADLTRGDVGGALRDTVEGAALGAGAGAVGHGLGKAVQWTGQKASNLLARARGQLVDEEAALAREGIEAAQESAGKLAEKERRMVGSAREMNKQIDARKAAKMERAQRLLARAEERKARGAARAADGAVRPARGSPAKWKPTEEQIAEEGLPDEVWRGYFGRGHNAVQKRISQEEINRMAVERGGLAGKRAQFSEEYAARVPTDDPYAAVGDEMRDELVRRYGPRTGDLVGPEGTQVVPRMARAPVTQEATAPPARGSTLRYGEGVEEAAPGMSLADEAEAMMAERRAAAFGADVGAGRVPAAPAPRAGPRPVDAPWEAGARPPERGPNLVPLPARRGSSPAFDVGGRPPPGFMEARTRAGGGAAPEVVPSMAAPQDMPLPPAPATRATHVPDLRRPVPLPPPAPQDAVLTQRLQPAAPPPAALPAPQAAEPTRLAAVDDVGALAQERALAREQRGFRGMLAAGYEGARGSSNALAAPLGAAVGVAREAFKNPAVRAQAISTLRLHLLQRVDPTVFARVSAALERVRGKGEGREAAVKHVLLQTDPAYREAERKIDETMKGRSDDDILRVMAEEGLL